MTSVCNVTAQIPRPDEKQVVVSFDLYERGQPKVANLQINMMFCFANNRVIVLRRRWTILSLLSTSVASKSIVEGTSINLELERRDETKSSDSCPQLLKKPAKGTFSKPKIGRNQYGKPNCSKRT